MSNLQYFSNNGNVTISTANPNLDGTGALGTVIVAGNDGTDVNAVTIKALGNTTQGIVRLFVEKSGIKYLMKEIMIPANIQTAVVQSYSATVLIPFTLETGCKLLASTQNAESFIVSANATDWRNCECIK